MNASETLALLEKLAVIGATHFKSDDFEIFLGGVPKPPEKESEPKPVQPNPQATAKAQALVNMLKMTPEELANQIFPEGA